MGHGAQSRYVAGSVCFLPHSPCSSGSPNLASGARAPMQEPCQVIALSQIIKPSGA